MDGYVRSSMVGTSLAGKQAWEACIPGAGWIGKHT